jgi:leucyl aminopeptidase
VQLRLAPGPASRLAADALIDGCFEAERKRGPIPSFLREDDRLSSGAVSSAWRRGELRGRRKDIVVIHPSKGARRIVLVGLGPRLKYSTEVVRRAAAEAVRALAGKGARRIVYRLESFAVDPVSEEEAVRAITDGAALGSYEFTRFKSKVKDEPVREVIIATATRSAPASELRRAFDEEEQIVGSVNFTRDIANLPANEATPARLAREAQALGKSHRLKVRVFDERALKRMGCGGILAVGSGSSHPPRLIVLEYPGRGRSPPTVAVVGKGITFDSGGVSIKPALNMSHMKFDKSGACAVLGILRAARELNVQPRVIGVMACAENLPSGTAYRPGDLVRTYTGSTIEVLNTDAEGRVVLADALGYAAMNYAPDAIVDLATLTGAETVALGDDIGGLISPNDRLAERLIEASADSGEPIWRMPLTDYHRELVRAAEFGDVRNSIEIPLAGMLTASAFLETFVGDRPWAHLDIAGPAYTTITTRRYQPAYQNVGAVGFGVRLVSRFLLDYVR